MKLTTGEAHLLRLVVKGKQSDGWTEVSEVVMPLVKDLPSELCEIKEEGLRGKIKLTPAGEAVVHWL